MLFDTFPTTSKFLDGKLIELTDIIRKVVFSDEVINLSDVMPSTGSLMETH